VIETVTALVVDDHALMQEWICMALQDYPAARIRVVARAADGPSALALARLHRPDLVCMDIDMPGMSGLEATRELRRILPDTPVVMISMHAEDEFVESAASAGAVAYVVKSRLVDDLPGAIDEALARRSGAAAARARGEKNDASQ